MQIVKSLLFIYAILCAGSPLLKAEVKTYDFEDPKGINNVSFLLDAPLESISGNAKGVSGIVTFDSANPKAVSGSITVETASLTATNNKLQEHMLGKGWLDAARYPTITFVAKSISKIEEQKGGFKAQLTGEFTLKGVTKELNVPVTFTYLTGMLGRSSNGAMEGDLLVLRSTFTINRSEYGIKPGQSSDKVAEEIELRLSIAGAAPDA
ncbi:MAG: YceI family protein [Verrucomicrobiota bacterium]|nr:YceI family protein [Verrucomicrobiota bacterium]